jgi:hypothetical protein
MEAEIKKIHSVLSELMTNKKVSFKVDNLSNKYHNILMIEPYYYTNSIYGSKLDGMVINYEDGIYEVCEFQAGENANELHIFLETKSFKVALKNMLIGNKRPQSKILKIWN